MKKCNKCGREYRDRYKWSWCAAINCDGSVSEVASASEAAQPVCSSRGLGGSASDRQPDAVSVAVGREESGLEHNPDLLISGKPARTLIQNAYALLRRKYRGLELWVMVRDLTGHGSGNAGKICETANLNPTQKCGKDTLEDCAPTLASATASERLTPNS